MSVSDREAERLFNEWTALYKDAASAESWCIIDVGHGSRYGRWQFHRPSSTKVPQTTHWARLLAGTGAHHEAAIELILKINPGEFDYWCRGARDAGMDLSDIPESRRHLVVAALLTE